MRRTATILALMGAAPAASLASDVEAGQAVYDRSCKSRHCAAGTSKPNIAKMTKVEMKDLQ
ncbi:MAG: hypothetical protein ABSG03_06205 [Bryobacteraceae bacterium]|jgi:cytochrome c5